MSTSTLKAAIRRGLAALAASSGITGRLWARAGAGFTCLTYHRVLPKERCGEYAEPLAIPADVFERQAEWLRDHGTVVTVSEALSRCRDGRLERERPLICVTFDDGYADNAEIAAPILERNGLVGTFFVVTGFVGDGTVLWYDRASAHWRHTGSRACLGALGAAGSSTPCGSERDWLEALKGLSHDQRECVLRSLDLGDTAATGSDLYRPMRPDDVRRLRGAGHEIGAHTATHPLLTRLDDAGLERELSEPRRRLAEWLGEAPPGLCYPNGDYDGRVSAAAERAGYRYACTTREGVNTAATPAMELRRRHIQVSHVTRAGGGHSDGALAAEVWGLHALLRARRGRA